MRVSRPHYRYLCLHFHFRVLHRRLTAQLLRLTQNAPLPLVIKLQIHRFGNMLHARLLSMPDRSTSELLRTLSMNGCFQANILAVLAIQPRFFNLAYIWGP